MKSQVRDMERRKCILCCIILTICLYRRNIFEESKTRKTRLILFRISCKKADDDVYILKPILIYDLSRSL